MVKHKATCTVLFIPTSLAFLPYNVTAYGLVLILFLCYVVALITVLVPVIDNIVNYCFSVFKILLLHLAATNIYTEQLVPYSHQFKTVWVSVMLYFI